MTSHSLRSDETILETLGRLYSERYFNQREEINNDGTQLRLLLHYKFH